MVPMRKGLIALLALVLTLHASIGCGVVQAAAAMTAPCCGQNCPIGAAVGESACCHAQDSGMTAQEISRPSVPAVQLLVGLMPGFVITSAPTATQQAGLVHA